jgi:hypothetical protein
LFVGVIKDPSGCDVTELLGKEVIDVILREVRVKELKDPLIE